MNRIFIYVGLLLALTACQAVGQSPSEIKLTPGATIDGMILTTGSKDAPPLWAFCSPALYVGNTATAECSVPLIARLAIGHIIMPGDDTLAMLDWSEISWELTIDGLPIDLKGFGTYNFALPARSHDPSPIREVFVHFTAWDVVLTKLSPGEHTLQGSAQMGTERYSWVIHLTIRANDPGTGMPWVEPATQEIS